MRMRYRYRVPMMQLRMTTWKFFHTIHVACIVFLWLLVSLASDRGGEEFESIQMSEAHRQQLEGSPSTRRDRFPSVEERVQIYMSNWYEPPCGDKEKHLFKIKGRSIEIDKITLKQDIRPDYLLWLNKSIVRDCARTREQVAFDRNNSISLPTEKYIDERARFNMVHYCVDVLEVFEILRHLPESSPQKVQIPLLMQFGDMKHSHKYGYVSLPHFKKFRSATDDLQSAVSSDTTACSHNPRRPLATAHGADTLQPIIWKMASHRHYDLLRFVSEKDRPWHLKKDMAIWRGQLTGSMEFFDPNLTDEQNCDNMIRCRLVRRNQNSTLIDAGLTAMPRWRRKRLGLPDVIGGVNMVKDKLSIRIMMECKGLIMLEGNDVASGLKWAMLSQSVVLMPKPMHTSWAMEERLEPWVHYVPLNDDATDVEAKMQWVVDHDEEARRIAERSTLWIEDLMYHPDAAREDRLVKREMIRRYLTHFTAAPA